MNLRPGFTWVVKKPKQMNMETITEISKVYPNWFSPESSLSYDEQKFIWESIPLSEYKLLETNENPILSGSLNAGCKRGSITDSVLSREKAILFIRNCDYKTPPKDVAIYLEQFFDGCGTKNGHWLYIAQHWTPRAINRTLDRIIREHKLGQKTIENPARYFTFLIKLRKVRRTFTISNASSKHLTKEGSENV